MKFLITNIFFISQKKINLKTISKVEIIIICLYKPKIKKRRNRKAKESEIKNNIMKTKNLIVPVFLALLLISFYACRRLTEAAILLVTNDTKGYVDLSVAGVETRLLAGDEYTNSWDVKVGNSLEVEITATGEYLPDYYRSMALAGGDDYDISIRTSSGLVRFINNTGNAITEIHITNNNTTDPEENILTTGTTIATGSSMDFIVFMGAYNFRVVCSNGSEYIKRWNEIGIIVPNELYVWNINP